MTAVLSVCIKKSTKIGKFLCRHFDIEDGRKYTTFCILCLIISRNVKMQVRRKHSFLQYGEGAVTDRMRRKWFAKFCAGAVSLDHAPWAGRVDQLS